MYTHAAPSDNEAAAYRRAENVGFASVRLRTGERRTGHAAIGTEGDSTSLSGDGSSETGELTTDV